MNEMSVFPGCFQHDWIAFGAVADAAAGAMVRLVILASERHVPKAGEQGQGQ